MPEAVIPVVAEEAVGATAAELAAQQAAQMAAAAEQAAQMAAAQQAAAEKATQAAAQQATTGGISDLVQPTTAPVNPAAAIQGTPLAQVGPAIPPSAPIQNAPLPPMAPPPMAPPPMAPPPMAPPPPAPPPISITPLDIGNTDGIQALTKEVTNPAGGTPLYPQNVAAQIPPAPSAMNMVQPTPPIEPGGQSLYGPNGVATGNPSPPPNTPTDVTYGAGQSRITTNPADLLNQPTPASDAMAGIKGLWQDFKAMPLKDKALTGLMASSAYQMLNQPKPYEPKKYKSTFNRDLYSGYNPTPPAPYQPQYAGGGLADLGGYSDGGRMLKGPGDGMSDDIPATIANKQPARLANEEFVVPADVVSHLGNGSSEAGAKVLYKMMDRVRQARTGSKKQGKQINPEKYVA